MKEIVIDGVTYVLTPKEENKLPESWEELNRIDGYISTFSSGVERISNAITGNMKKNIFATKEQAEASIALAQLSQLLKVYQNGWEPDWNDKSQNKFVLYFYKDKIIFDNVYFLCSFLSFPTAELRDHFLEHHKELIIKAKPLLG